MKDLTGRFLVVDTSCGLPMKIENGDFVFCSEAVLIYFCYSGYRLEGHEELVCQGNQWSTKPPFCSGTVHYIAF